MRNITRKNFLAAAGATAAAVGLAACSSDTEETTEETTDETEEAASTDDALAAPDASSYPIDPDDDTVEALWTSEEVDNDGWVRVTQGDGAELGVMDSSKLIQVSGYAFKDLNGNGKLDLYEDWRQTSDDRAAALAAELSGEECMPLMFHGDFSLTSTDIDDDQLENLSGGQRAGVIRSGGDADTYVTAVKWTNAVQEYCEENGGYGIPYWNSTDPYMFHDVPENFALAATFDPDVFREAANYSAQGWRSVGITCDLGPQIDLASNPTYSRFSGTICGDPALNRDLVRAYVDGLQSTYDEDGNDLGWGSESVMGMMKHYPSDAACEGGRNSHNAAGKYAVYANDDLASGLVGFDAALKLDGATEQIGSVMPFYAIPYTDDEHFGENVAAAYNSYVLGLLRNAGWEGVICTDWQITQETYFDGAFEGRHFGVDDLTPTERIAKGYEAGTDEFGGEFQLEQGLEAYELLKEDLGEDAALERVQDSARRLFRAEMNLGLFENPYLDRTVAKAYFEDTTIDEWSAEVAPKCVVMLKNSGGVICERSEKPSVYVPLTFTEASENAWTGETTAASWSLPVDEDVLSEYVNIVTDTLLDPSGDADSDGNATYTADDVTRATSDELADCDFALVVASGPSMGDDSTTDEDGNTVYMPHKLTYGSYTADGPNVREVSLAGDTLEDGSIENRSYYGLTVEGDTTELDNILSVVELAGDVPVVVAMSSSQPMIFSEFEDQVAAILYTAGSTNTTAIAKIVGGSVEPSGLLPFQMPADMDTVEANAEDTPRDCIPYTDSEGNEYDFAFGLNWSGVINDDRVATYAVDPISTLETITL